MAKLYIRSFSCPYVDLHPTKFQTSEVKQLLESATNSPLLQPTIVWIDEVHRLTRPQQDLLLRGVEEGVIACVAATTENPSFVVAGALLSRLTVLSFDSLQEEDLLKVFDRVCTSYPHITFTETAKNRLISWTSGDARKLLGVLETLVEHPKPIQYDVPSIEQHLSLHNGPLSSEGEGRYLLISALHKAVRGSDCNAALYWFSRLLHAGEDPLYIARRMIRMATEDIGLADPQALAVAIHGHTNYQLLGSPEGELGLAEVVIYLALAPKSAAAYVGFDAAKEEAQRSSSLLPPMHILNAPTSWMERQGFGAGYQWDHETPEGFSGQEYFPTKCTVRSFYHPVQRGFERELIKRIEYFKKLKEKKAGEPPASDTYS
jgi:putative ATPase